VVGEHRPKGHTTTSFAIVDIGQQDRHAEPAGPDRGF
jgi:hypothetical protein